MKAAIDALLRPKTFLSSTRSRIVASAVVLVALLAVGVTALEFGSKGAAPKVRTIIETPVGIVHAGSAAGAVLISGSGSTFAQPFLAAALPYYAENNPVAVSYNPTGSGTGIKQFTNNQTDFGVSDTPMNAAQLLAANGNGSGVLQLPILLGGEAVIYNLDLPASTQLRMDGPTLAAIFMGKITNWDDPALATLNPGVHLPNMPITTVHRSDGSGTTYIFTDYLSKASTDFQLNVGPGLTVPWPGGAGESGNLNVANYVLHHTGSIGYVELKFALDNKLSYMNMKNAAGNYVVPSSASILAAADQYPGVTATNFSITNAPGANSYPITGYSWALVRALHSHVSKGKALIELFEWLTTAGQSYAGQLNYVPLPDFVRAESLKTLQGLHLL